MSIKQISWLRSLVTDVFLRMNIAEALRLSETLSSDSAKLDAELLLAFALGQSRTYLYTWPERPLSDDQQQQFRHLIARRSLGEPVAYILETREFWSLPLLVGPSTLIPRPDTEVLVETALNLFPHPQDLNVLDLGTGTGAIALALASEWPQAQVQAVDFNLDAVNLAKKNCSHLNITNAHFFQSDWFAQVEGQFDLIVSNPPYIDAQDPHLQQGDVRFEPASALVAENNGLADLHFIIQHAHAYLKNGAWLLLEHGCEQAEQVKAQLVESGFTEVFTQRDYTDNERVSGGCWRL